MALLLLTRPRQASQSFADMMQTDDSFDVIISPMLEIVAHHEGPMPDNWQGLIFTSAHAVTHFEGRTSGPAHVVGARTAKAAMAAGFDVETQAETASELAKKIATDAAQPLLFARGVHTAQPMVAMLAGRGVVCKEWIVYDQRAKTLNKQAKSALAGEQPIVLPLFSPRSADLFVKNAGSGALTAPLHIVAMSKAVADAAAALDAASCLVAEAPDAKAMGEATLNTLRSVNRS